MLKRIPHDSITGQEYIKILSGVRTAPTAPVTSMRLGHSVVNVKNDTMKLRKRIRRALDVEKRED